MKLKKKHKYFALRKRSKPGKLKPMFGKQHYIESKFAMSLAKSNFTLGLYYLKDNLINTFPNQVVLVKFLNLSKSTCEARYKF